MDFINTVDSAIFAWIAAVRTPLLTTVMQFFTIIGSAIPISIIAFLTLLMIYWRWHCPKIAGRLVFCSLLGVTLLNKILKLMIMRPRNNVLPWLIIPEDQYSFPSGHSSAATAFCGALLYLIARDIIPCKHKKIAFTCLSVIPLLIAFSRVYLGVHYFSDIIGGIFLGLIWLAFSIILIKQQK